MVTALYIHFPFCLRKCRYCDFNSVAVSPVSHRDYTEALVREMEIRRTDLPPAVSASTLYLGGGTPSIMEPGLAKMLLNGAERLFALAKDAEVTIEANPGTVKKGSLKSFRTAGFNRISLGLQSFSDTMLEKLGRSHDCRDGVAAVKAARDAGFDNIGIDLIHSLPGQTIALWIEELDRAVSLMPEHISAYGLSIEPGTPFHAMERSGEIALPDEDTVAGMFEITSQRLAMAGYEHYEISNYAKPGFRSRHNQVYWRRTNYLGFGAGAHSFLSAHPFGRRWQNIASPEKYIQSIGDGFSPVEELSAMSREEAMGERLFLGLRMLDGIDSASFRREFGASIEEKYPEESKELVRGGFLQWSGNRLRLTRKGLILSNQVFMKFLR